MYAYAAEAQPASPTHGSTAHIQPLSAFRKGAFQKVQVVNANNRVLGWI